MRVLLIGEFSALHKNLKEGLSKLGHEVDVMASGDGWKDIPRDIDIGSKYKGFWGALDRRLKVFKSIHKLKGYDVVQFVNPFSFFYIPFFTKYLIKYLKKNNNKIFLLAAGTDAIYFANAERYLRYTPLDDYLKFDYKKDKHKYQKYFYKKFNRWLASYVDGIIPIMYDYKVCYSDFKNVLPCIPIPMNIDSINYKENTPSERIVVFHGLNRYGFKGTKYIEEAFSLLENDYHDKVDFIIRGNMPLNEYLEVMEKVNIVVDQTSSYSSGVNAVYALAMGKIVLGGSEIEALECFGLESSPVINILPDANDIRLKLIDLFERTHEFSALGRLSRRYAEEQHNYIKVAQRYLDVWVCN